MISVPVRGLFNLTVKQLQSDNAELRQFPSPLGDDLI